MRVLFPLVFVTCSSVVALRAAVPGGDDVLRNYYSLEVSLSLIYEPRTCPLLVMNREGVVVLVASCFNATVYVVMRTLLIRRLRPLTLPAQTNVGVGCAVRKVCGTDGVCLVEGCCGASLVHALSYGGRVLVFESWCLPRRGHFLDREARGKKRKVGNTRFQGLRRLEIWRSTAPAFFIGGASGELKRCFSTACASNFDTGRYQLSREAMVLRPPPPRCWVARNNVENRCILHGDTGFSLLWSFRFNRCVQWWQPHFPPSAGANASVEATSSRWVAPLSLTDCLDCVFECTYRNHGGGWVPAPGSSPLKLKIRPSEC